MTISPAFATSRPLKGFVSFAGIRERLLVLELYSPLNGHPDEMTPLGNAVATATSRGCYVAIHTPHDDLRAKGKIEQTLANQAWLLSEAVRNGRGRHVDRFRVYHHPPPPGQQRLFGRPVKPVAPRRTGCDIVIVNRTRQKEAAAIHGILMLRYSYNEIMDGALRGTPIPETDPVHAHYLKMFRSTTSVTTQRFPLAKSWKRDDGIEEIDLNDVP